MLALSDNTVDTAGTANQDQCKNSRLWVVIGKPDL